MEGGVAVGPAVVDGGAIARQERPHDPDIADGGGIEDVQTVGRLGQQHGQVVGQLDVARVGGRQDRRQTGAVARPQELLVGVDRGVDGHVVAVADGLEE